MNYIQALLLILAAAFVLMGIWCCTDQYIDYMLLSPLGTCIFHLFRKKDSTRDKQDLTAGERRQLARCSMTANMLIGLFFLIWMLTI